MDPAPKMRPKSSSGFYLSRKTVVFFSLLILVLLLLSTVLAILYGKLRAEKTHTSTAWEPPSTDWELPVPGRQGPWNNSRLPSSLIPGNYQLELWLRLVPREEQPDTFFGQVNVTVTCREETGIILLHSLQLQYTTVTVSHAGPELHPSPLIRDTWFEVQNQYLVIELNDTLVPGQDYIIQANYSGQLKKNQTGLFINYYQEWGINKTIVASQLQSVHARSVFPCFDEPAMKATFDIRLVYHPQFVALCNMPAIDFSERREEDGTWKVTTFNTTMKMSTYLVAFVFSEYGYINTTCNGVEIRVWADEETLLNGDVDYALKIAGRLLIFFEEYFNVSYSLSKLDLVVLTQYKSAMENWGLLIFKKDSLLYHPKKKFIEDRLGTSTLIAHELAHQWFGNLATMNWWNELWLNEGFATYFEYIGAFTTDPSIRIDNIHLIHLVYGRHFKDADLYAPSLSEKEEYVSTPEEIDQMFSEATYMKGAIIIQMACHFMTEELLMKGLRSYLKTFSYSNAVADDIWNHFQKVIDSQDRIKLPASVKPIMDTWTRRGGFPLLTVNTTSGIITQEHYFEKQMENRTSISPWFIPIVWMKSGSMQPLIWLVEKYETFPEVKCTTDEEWVLLNINVSGFYKVKYDDSNWQRLRLQLNKDSSVIPVINRAQIISDAFDCAWAGYADIEIALETTIYLAKEQGSIVWHITLTHLKQLELLMMKTASYGLYKKYILNRIAPFYYYQMKLINNDFNNIHSDAIAISLFTKTLKAACLLGLKDCMDRASRLYSQFMSNPTNNTIPKPLREAIFCGALKAGTDKEWDFAFSMYQNHTSEDLLMAMACSTEPWILNRYLHYTMDKSRISLDHASVVFKHVADNPIGWFLLWNFIKENWKNLQTIYPGHAQSENVLQHLAIGFSTDFEFKELELLLNSTDDEEQSTEVQNIIQIIKIKMDWMKKLYPKIRNWLRKNIHAG